MKIAVTIRSGDDLRLLQALIESLRSALKDVEVTVLEAPRGVDYPFQFPVVTVGQGTSRDRHFGSEAVSVLKQFAEAK